MARKKKTAGLVYDYPSTSCKSALVVL